MTPSEWIEAARRIFRGPKPFFKLFVLSLTICINVQAQNSPENLEATRLALAKSLRISNDLERLVKAHEPKWKLKDTQYDGGAYKVNEVYHMTITRVQRWKASSLEIEVRIQVYESPEEASQQQELGSNWSSITSSFPLDGVGDQAYYISQRYFSWISTRRGSVVVGVYGPPQISYTRGFINLALQVMADKSSEPGIDIFQGRH